MWPSIERAHTGHPFFNVQDEAVPAKPVRGYEIAHVNPVLVAASLLKVVKQDEQERQSGQALLAVYQEKCALATICDDRAEEVGAIAVAMSDRSSDWSQLPRNRPDKSSTGSRTLASDHPYSRW